MAHASMRKSSSRQSCGTHLLTLQFRFTVKVCSAEIGFTSKITRVACCLPCNRAVQGAYISLVATQIFLTSVSRERSALPLTAISHGPMDGLTPSKLRSYTIVRGTTFATQSM